MIYKKAIYVLCMSLCIACIFSFGCVEKNDFAGSNSEIIAKRTTHTEQRQVTIEQYMTRGSRNTSVSSTMKTTIVSTKSKQSFYTKEDKMEDVQLFVRGKRLPGDIYITLNHNLCYAELPLLTILRELGAKVTKTNEDSVQILLNDKTYDLNMAKGSLCREDSSINILSIPPGTHHERVFKTVDGEVIVDSDSAKAFFFYMIGVQLNINYKNSIVTID